MIALAPEDVADVRRWAICAAIIVFAHGGIAAAMVGWREPIEVADYSGAVVIEFSPVPVAPATLETNLPTGPLQDMSPATPSMPVDGLEEKEKIERKVETKPERKVEETVASTAEEETPLEVKPAPNPEVAIQAPAPQEVKQETPKRQDPRPETVLSVPNAIAEEIAALPAAPIQGKIIPDASNAVPNWMKRVSTLFERHKRYPESAQSRGLKGVVELAFSIDRQGRIVDGRIARSSGVATLDEEALAILRRAEPFPAPPPELVGDQVILNVPIRFNIK